MKEVLLARGLAEADRAHAAFVYQSLELDPSSQRPGAAQLLTNELFLIQSNPFTSPAPDLSHRLSLPLRPYSDGKPVLVNHTDAARLDGLEFCVHVSSAL